MNYCKAAKDDTIQKTPYHIEVANEVFERFIGLDGRDQVDAFKHLQRKLAEHRFEVTKNMQIESENFAIQIKNQIDGTDIIASGL